MARLENPRMKTGADASLGLKVRKARLSAGVTQEELAGFLGISFQQLQKVEYGQNRLPAVRLFDIAGFLGVPVEEFFQPVTPKDREIYASERSVAVVRRFNALSEADQDLAFAILGTMSDRAKLKARKLTVVAA